MSMGWRGAGASASTTAVYGNPDGARAIRCEREAPARAPSLKPNSGRILVILSEDAATVRC
jgi:hypothetical protein